MSSIVIESTSIRLLSNNFVDGLCRFIAWHLLPKNLVMWCALRVIEFSASGAYSGQIVSNLTALTAVDRWLKGMKVQK